LILLDTNLLIYASVQGSPFEAWSKQIISNAVATDGASINAISVAELCVGEEKPEHVADTLRSWGINILDVPAAAAEVSAIAYRRYRQRRQEQSGKSASAVPLPDFFIGAHAEIMHWSLATADLGRFKTYFPSVALIAPE
jgi:predicted nucleic acid-binding protein